ncbi:SMAD/FHA domain-containing protein [Klebsormidium nitens]|uniref:SMAD/FHA domain-containing protein n=1 Tax=Klebsormidium nitens TaxID=105231 RepID=A0A1Y1I4G8_KLENI|nr:SMAD/FHA domain-containing protein [Klebsormidium nitens]|eukprot:GAQ84061.1 SMAD/FHA domain-containing protein [Klebsormidium nitens]
MAAGRGRDMVKPAWMKEEQRKQAGRRSRSRSPPPRPKLRPPDRDRDSHREDRNGRESEREREREREGHRDHRSRDHRQRSRSPERNGGAQRARARGEDEAGRGGDDRRRDERSREEKRPRQEPLRKDSPEEQAEPPPVDASLAAMEAAQKALEEKEAQKVQPDFGYSGKLAEETNKVNGIALVFNEPPEARKPTRRWRLYVFKGDEPLKDPLYIHRQSCYLFGRERKIADIPTDHPSCSKQHAVIQFRLTEREGADGMMKSLVVPYIMDLGSTNGTYLNGKRIEAQRYHELLEKDAIKFGNSTREYVLLHENSAGQ